MQHSKSVAINQSSIGVFARSLDTSLLGALRLSESVVLITDTVVSLCRALTDANDARPWQDRIEDYFMDLDDEEIERILITFANEFTSESLQQWAAKYKDENYQNFAERLLGAARYALFLKALKEDAAVVALAIRRGVRALMPFAVAWRDALSLMTSSQLKAANRSEVLTFNAVQIIIKLDDFLGDKLFSSLPMEVTTATRSDLAVWAPDGEDNLVAQFRDLVTVSSAKRVERANSPLVRKIRGARDALKYSEDGVSQAANSLIELIDRIMRDAFPPKDVLLWVDQNFSDHTGLTHYDKDDVRKPTKRAEALCLVYGGGSIGSREANQYDSGEGPSFLHDVIALVLVSSRNKLQNLKHADQGTSEERAQLLAVLSALEGALMIGLTFGRISAESTSPKELPAA